MVISALYNKGFQGRCRLHARLRLVKICNGMTTRSVGGPSCTIRMPTLKCRVQGATQAPEAKYTRVSFSLSDSGDL